MADESLHRVLQHIYLAIVQYTLQLVAAHLYPSQFSGAFTRQIT